MRKDSKSCKLGKIGPPSHSEPLQWEKIRKVANWAKLAVLSHSKPLQWEKIRKVANWEKLAISSHSEPLVIKPCECMVKPTKLANVRFTESDWLTAAASGQLC